jgi:transposase
MSKTKEFSEDLKKVVISALRKGKSQAQVAKDFGLSRQIVNIWNNKQLTTGTTDNKKRPGRPSKITCRTKNVIRKLSKADPRKTAVDINRDLREYHNLQISNSAVKVILR